VSDPLEALLGPIFQARRQASPDFLTRANVVACGVGYKIKGTEQTTTPSVVVSVSRKLPPDQVHPDALIPKMIQNVPTDVVETGEIVGLDVSRTTALRPARPGVSISNINGATGTIGCIVKRGDQVFILSNNHVLGVLNGANPGDAVVQPGTADGGQRRRAVNPAPGLRRDPPDAAGQPDAAADHRPATATSRFVRQPGRLRDCCAAEHRPA